MLVDPQREIFHLLIQHIWFYSTEAWSGFIWKPHEDPYLKVSHGSVPEDKTTERQKEENKDELEKNFDWCWESGRINDPKSFSTGGKMR